MSRPASCTGVYGFNPATGSVVDLWKNSGTISTRPPTATTRTISTIIRALFFSIISWLKFMMGLSAQACAAATAGMGGIHRRLAGYRLANTL